MGMWRRAPACAMIPAPADHDCISDTGSSTSVPSPPPQPRRRRQQTHFIPQVVRRAAAAPVAAEQEVTSQAVEGSASSEVPDTAINKYLLARGLLPMTRSAEGPEDVDLNALAPPPPPRRAVLRPVICAFCNCAFCFGADEVPALDPGPGHVYPEPPVPITLDLLTPPAVWPLRRGDSWGPAAVQEWLLVCTSRHHFNLTMGMLQQGGAPPPLLWKCPHCLNVLPVAVGTLGSNSPDLLVGPAPPMEPWRYAGAYWNYVRPGDEDIVELRLHHDPLKLTLGRQ